jgi:hypothetical protein
MSNIKLNAPERMSNDRGDDIGFNHYFCQAVFADTSTCVLAVTGNKPSQAVSVRFGLFFDAKRRNGGQRTNHCRHAHAFFDFKI